MTIVGMFFVRQLPDGNVHAGEVVESLSDSYYAVQFDSSATELTAPLSVVHLSQMVTDEYALFRSRDDVAAWIGLICAEREGAVAVMTNPGGEGKPN